MAVTKVQDFDICKVKPDTKFILDTNVLYFVHSGYYVPTYEKSIIYSNLLQQIISNKNEILVATLSMQELLFGVENKEYEKYCIMNGIADKRVYSKKAFRRNTVERANIQKKMKTILTEITNIYSMINGEIKEDQVNSFVDEFLKYQYDPIDYIVVDNLFRQDNVFFISDDIDFQFDARIKVITA